MATRSRQVVFHRSVAGIVATPYTVPEGRCLILKTIYVHNHAGSAATVAVSAQSAGPGFPFITLLTKSMASGEVASFDGWLVLLAHDSLTCFSNLDDADFVISGAELPEPI